MGHNWPLSNTITDFEYNLFGQKNEALFYRCQRQYERLKKSDSYSSLKADELSGPGTKGRGNLAQKDSQMANDGLKSRLD